MTIMMHMAMVVVVVVVMMIVVMTVMMVMTLIAMGVRNPNVTMIFSVMMVGLLVMKVGRIHLLMQMFVQMVMSMQMHVKMGIRPMCVPMGMQELTDNMAMLLIHILSRQDVVQQLMSHKCQRHLQLVFLEQLAIVQYLR